MTFPTKLTWDIVGTEDPTLGTGPRRPGTTDTLTGTKVNDLSAGAIPTDQPSADEYNQLGWAVAALAKVAPNLILSVRFSGGTPGKYKFLTPGSVLVSADITLTDNGVGDTTVSITANKLPSSDAEPVAAINGSSVGMIAVETVSATSWRVRTLNSSGVATDLNWTLTLY